MQKTLKQNSFDNIYICALDGKVSVKSAVFYSQQFKGNKLIFFNAKEIEENELKHLSSLYKFNYKCLRVLFTSPNGKGFKRNLYFICFIFLIAPYLSISNRNTKSIILISDKSKSLILTRLVSLLAEVYLYPHSGINKNINNYFQKLKINSVKILNNEYMSFVEDSIKSFNKNVSKISPLNTICLFPKFVEDNSKTRNILMEVVELCIKDDINVFISLHPKIQFLEKDILQFENITHVDNAESFVINNKVPCIAWHGSIIDLCVQSNTPVACYWNDWFLKASPDGNRYHKDITFLSIKSCYEHIKNYIKK